MKRLRWAGLLGLLLLTLSAGSLARAGRPAAQADGLPGGAFVRRSGSELRVGGKPFRFAGSNNYYLMYKSQAMVDHVLQAAASSGFDVLRMWGSLEIGNQDGSNSIHGKADGVYFQYWDGTGPAYNDGPDGLQRLDYIIYRAGQLGIRLVIPLVNNWRDFGGMDQYVRWRGGQYHDQFYSDPLIRQWYKSWIAHLLNRTNSYTGVKYKDDPTIMTWELGNEPRCKGSGVYPQSSACTTQTITAWADELSRFIKEQDPNHLISVGDEGFYCTAGSWDWTENCNEGVDTLALARLPQIDVMSLHLYPEPWGKTPEWGLQWIERHIRDAKRLNKAVMLGEFGLPDKHIRNPIYRQWTDAVYQNGGNGALYWILSDKQDDGSLYPDYDGLTVYCPSPVCTTLRNFATMMAGGGTSFAPVADDDTAVTEFEMPIGLNPASNDLTYDGAVLLGASIDLDPAAPGPQTTRSVYGGSFALQTDGSVLFTPEQGFSGKTAGSYTISDSLGRLSNAATLSVTVKPSPTGVLQLFSFETGTAGWAPASWQTDAGSVAQSSDFQSDGSYSLQINSNGGAWFGIVFNTPLDLSGKTHLKYELQTGAAGTSRAVALQLGESWEWCQTGWGWINQDSTTTVDVDLTQELSCDLSKLSQVRAIYMWISAGTFYVDAVRAE